MNRRREVVAIWLSALAYTGYVVGVTFLCVALLPEVPAVLLGLLLTLGPIVALTIWGAG